MSRRPPKKPTPGQAQRQEVTSNARHERFINRVVGLPRVVRIVIAAVFALAVTVALSPIVDAIYLRFLFTEQTRIAPSLVSTAFGLVMYMTGWQLIVGTVGEQPPARFMILWYFGLGIVAILLTVLWLVQGIGVANAG